MQALPPISPGKPLRELERSSEERDQAEEAIRRLASIVESSSEAIYSKTLAGVITSWNSGAEQLYGYAASEMIGHSISILIPPDNQAELMEIIERIKAGEALKNRETWRVRKDGTLIEVSVTISPIRDAQRRIVGSSTLAHDITEQKRMVEALALRNSELGRVNKELRLQQEKLTEVNVALEQANLARSQFLSTMSHELRTPLASIMGFSEILLDAAIEADGDQQQRSNLESILTNSEHLLELINDVLDLSKIETGHMVLDFRQVDPRDLLGEVAAEIGSLATKRNLFLRIEVEEGIDCLVTNAVKLRQILLNLVSNALKFTEHGGVTLSARRVALSGTGTEGIAFAVQDSGIGIPAELQERIFEAFYQVDMSYTRKVGGTGLGLAIVSRLTALLGGTITLASSPGQGSIFTVTLPIKAAHLFNEQELPRLHSGQQKNILTPAPPACELIPAASPETLAGSRQPAAAAGQRDLILVVDDNPETLVIIQKALQDTPYTLIAVQDPLTVMELMQELHPCAITLDVMMPQLNGWQLLHQLKDNPATSSIPVVMLTVLSEEMTGYVLGADDYLIKPFKKEVLRNTLARVIAASKRVAQPVARGD